MQTLSSPVQAQVTAAQSGWCEVYDIYLKSAITTPWGTTSILRLTDLPGGLTFFTPQISPEADGNRGVSQVYNAWALKRETIKGDAKFSSDKVRVTASNVTAEWAAMVAAIDWYDTPIVIRKVSTTIAGATADDCVVLWAGAIDALKITEELIALESSSDVSTISNCTLPRENMHTNCRFKWADDQCTQLRYKSTNYKAKTVGSASSATVVKSTDLTEDTATAGSYGTDLIGPLSSGAITASSEGAGWTNQTVSVYNINFLQFTLNAHKLSMNDPVQFTSTGTLPAGISAGVTYYAYIIDANHFEIQASVNGGQITATTSGSGTIKVSTVGTFKAASVRSTVDGYWKLGDTGDWGVLTAGFYSIIGVKAGLANPLLSPYIQFDFGSAKTPRLWRISTVSAVRLEELVRVIEIFSSTNATDWTFETYAEMPPRGGVLYEIQLPTASTARYWRICIRSRWAQSIFYALLGKVYAYEDSRHFWAYGRLTFDPATATVALRGVSRRVLESYSGQVVIPALPTAPANGDTFVIERGCPRTFNACCARQNWENFGGFLDLPYQGIIR